MPYRIVIGTKRWGLSLISYPRSIYRKILHGKPIYVVRDSMNRSAVAALALIVFLTATAPAYAYVDPGTGSMLVQLVTGGVAGALVLVRLYARRIKDKLTNRKTAQPPHPEQQPIGR